MFWLIWWSVAATLAGILMASNFTRRVVDVAPTIPETERVGSVSAFNVDWLKRQYMEREDWTAWDFEERLDEFVRQSSRPIATPEEDVTLIQASAAVLCQSSAGVIPPGMSVHEYAEQLRNAGVSPSGLTASEYVQAGFPNRFAGAARCQCGCLDSLNHRVMCWQADRAPAGSHLPGEPDEAY